MPKSRLDLISKVETSELFNTDWLKKNRSVFIDFSLLLDSEGRLYKPAVQPIKYDSARVTVVYWHDPDIRYK